ncbi:MAG: diguanylate cyclase [Candidatus Sedimenticola sp. (ex Thyasira tokunagai)]
MKGDIRIVKGEIEAITDLPDFAADKSEKFRTVYVLLRDLCSSGRLNQLFENFLHMVGVPAAIIDLDANVLASSNWQRICRDFHRENSVTCARCIESDTELANQLEAGELFTMYRCKNGLTDCASPIIIEGEHVANLFMGQFLFEEPDLEFFEYQAEQFGFERKDYLQALNEVPVVSESLVPSFMNFLVGFAQLIAALGLEKFHALEVEANQRQHLERQVEERTRELQKRTEELEKAKQELALLASMDGLTKIANRRNLDDYIEKEWLRLTRSKGPLSLIMIDIDHFKAYNDSYGHLSGDDCLVTIAWILRESTRRPADFAARYGGEEFACVLSDTDQEGALHVAEVISQNLKELAIPHETSPVKKIITLSMGVATCIPTAEAEIQELVEAADRCLYQAKEQGRNRIVSISI